MGESNSVGAKFRQPCPAPEFVGLIRGRGRFLSRIEFAIDLATRARGRRHADTPTRSPLPLTAHHQTNNFVRIGFRGVSFTDLGASAQHHDAVADLKNVDHSVDLPAPLSPARARTSPG